MAVLVICFSAVPCCAGKDFAMLAVPTEVKRAMAIGISPIRARAVGFMSVKLTETQALPAVVGSSLLICNERH